MNDYRYPYLDQNFWKFFCVALLRMLNIITLSLEELTTCSLLVIQLTNFFYSSLCIRLSQSSPASTDQDFKSKRISQISSCSSGSCPLQPPTDGSTHGSTPTPPPLPERTDSLNNRTEEGELRAAPWFQAGIPRWEASVDLCVLRGF